MPILYPLHSSLIWPHINDGSRTDKHGVMLHASLISPHMNEGSRGELGDVGHIEWVAEDVGFATFALLVDIAPHQRCAQM